jgi:hypothetical protein
VSEIDDAGVRSGEKYDGLHDANIGICKSEVGEETDDRWLGAHGL